MLKVDTHCSFWAKVQTALGVLFGMVILILVLKCYFTCQHSRTQEMTRQEMGELRKTQEFIPGKKETGAGSGYGWFSFPFPGNAGGGWWR